MDGEHRRLLPQIRTTRTESMENTEQKKKRKEKTKITERQDKDKMETARPGQTAAPGFVWSDRCVSFRLQVIDYCKYHSSY